MQLKRPKTHMAAAIALGCAMTLAGCSNGKGGGGGQAITSTETPAQAVGTALANLGKQSSVKVAFTLPLTASQLQSLNSSSKSGKLSDTALHALSTGSIFFTVATGHGESFDSAQAAGDTKSAVDFGLTIGSDTPFEVMYVDQNLYLRAQVGQLLTDVGQDPAQGAKVTGALAQANTFVPGISDLGAGKWVEISHTSLESIGQQFKQLAGSGANSFQPPSASTILKLRSQILGALRANATFASAGASGGRNHYTATINVSGAIHALIPIMSSLYSAIPLEGSKISSSLSNLDSQVPAGISAVLDLYASDNKLVEADLDANQFQHKEPFPIPLRLTFSSPGAPSAPSGATNLDLSKLPSLLGGLIGGLGKGSGG